MDNAPPPSPDLRPVERDDDDRGVMPECPRARRTQPLPQNASAIVASDSYTALQSQAQQLFSVLDRALHKTPAQGFEQPTIAECSTQQPCAPRLPLPHCAKQKLRIKAPNAYLPRELLRYRPKQRSLLRHVLSVNDIDDHGRIIVKTPALACYVWREKEAAQREAARARSQYFQHAAQAVKDAAEKAIKWTMKAAELKRKRQEYLREVEGSERDVEFQQASDPQNTTASESGGSQDVELGDYEDLEDYEDVDEDGTFNICEESENSDDDDEHGRSDSPVVHEQVKIRHRTDETGGTQYPPPIGALRDENEEDYIIRTSPQGSNEQSGELERKICGERGDSELGPEEIEESAKIGEGSRSAGKRKSGWTAINHADVMD
jgi:hypothetical protein